MQQTLRNNYFFVFFKPIHQLNLQKSQTLFPSLITVYILFIPILLPVCLYYKNIRISACSVKCSEYIKNLLTKWKGNESEIISQTTQHKKEDSCHLKVVVQLSLFLKVQLPTQQNRVIS